MGILASNDALTEFAKDGLPEFNSLVTTTILKSRDS
jgi:hypothetical protein